MDYKKINEILADFDAIRTSSKYKLVESIDGVDSNNGDYGDYEVYETGIEDILIKLEIENNSYSDEEEVIGIQFVKIVKRQILEYKTI